MVDGFLEESDLLTELVDEFGLVSGKTTEADDSLLFRKQQRKSITANLITDPLHLLHCKPHLLHRRVLAE